MSDELATTPTEPTVPSAPKFESMVDAETLSPEEQLDVAKLVEELQAKFENDDYTSTYGAITQAEVARFAREAMGDTRVYQLGQDAQKMLRDFKNKLEAYKELDDTRNALGLPSLFKKLYGELKWWLTKYKKITDYIDDAEKLFKKQIMELKVGLKVNEKALEVNLRSRRALIVHIVAGKQALKWAREVRLPELKAKAEASKSRTDIEVATDFAKRCDTFELKLGALDTSLAITYIRKPEIDMLRDSQRLAISTFENLVAHAIPMWFEDMRLALGVNDAAQANQNAQAGKEISEDLFMSNIERIGEVAEHAAKNAEAGFISTKVLIEGTDKLIVAVTKVDAAMDQAIANTRQYEKDRAANNERIKELQVQGLAAS